MRRNDVARSVAKAVGLEVNQVERIIVLTMDTIKEAVRKGKKVTFRGFGTFSARTCRPKKVRDINRKIAMVLPAHKKPHFKPSKQYFRIS